MWPCTEHKARPGLPDIGCFADGAAFTGIAEEAP